jgi:hypothetical protein
LKEADALTVVYKSKFELKEKRKQATRKLASGNHL